MTRSGEIGESLRKNVPWRAGIVAIRAKEKRKLKPRESIVTLRHRGEAAAAAVATLPSFSLSLSSFSPGEPCAYNIEIYGRGRRSSPARALFE